MQTFRFRPNLLRLEDRLTPATMADVAAASAFIGRQAQDIEWMAHPSARQWVQSYFTDLYQDMTSVMPTLSNSPAAGTAQYLATFAIAIGEAVNFTVVPEVPPPPPPPADAGMTNTIPDVNSSSWQNQLNGVKTWDVRVGTGDAVDTGNHVTIFYTGWLLNGTVFDSKRVGSAPPSPIEFDLDNLIEGWKQGIPGMKDGGIRRLYIPYQLAYGDAGKPAPATPPGGVTIPPKADLVFEIKLISHRT